MFALWGSIEAAVLGTFPIGPFETEEQLFLTVMAFALVIAGGVMLYMAGMKARVNAAMILNRPISAAAVADAEGVVEVQGAAKPITEEGEEHHPDDPILYTEREERVTDDEVDHTTPSKTTTISRDEHKEPFLIEDDSGTVAVDPRGASLNLRERRVTRGGRNQRYRANVKPGDTVHVFGEKRTADDPDDAPGDDPHYIGTGDEVPAFTISDRGQARTIVGGIKRMIGMGFLGVMLILFGVAIVLSDQVPFA